MLSPYPLLVSLALVAPAVEVARVDGEPILAGQVEYQLHVTLTVDPAPEVRDRAFAQMLEQMIRQRLVEGFLVRGTPEFTVRDLDAALEKLKAQEAAKGRKFEDYLNTNGWRSEAICRKRWAWSLGWPKYLAARLTNERLEQAFAARRVELDGTRIQATQVFMRVAEPRTEASLAKAVERATQVRGLVAEGKLSFEEAVDQYSEAPSAAAGGALGLCAFSDMPEKLARAAFSLKQGEISSPVVTPFGVHLVRVTEVQPGRGSWQDVRKTLEAIVTRELFEEIAGKERPQAKIQYTGARPYLDGNGKLVQTPRP